MASAIPRTFDPGGGEKRAAPNYSQYPSSSDAIFLKKVLLSNTFPPQKNKSAAKRGKVCYFLGDGFQIFYFSKREVSMQNLKTRLMDMLLSRACSNVLVILNTEQEAISFLSEVKAACLEEDDVIVDKYSGTELLASFVGGGKFRAVAKGVGYKAIGNRFDAIFVDYCDDDKSSQVGRERFRSWLQRCILPCSSEKCLVMPASI